MGNSIKKTKSVPEKVSPIYSPKMSVSQPKDVLLVPKETLQVPKETLQVPKETTLVLKKANLVPSEMIPVPKPSQIKPKRTVKESELPIPPSDLKLEMFIHRLKTSPWSVESSQIEEIVVAIKKVQQSRPYTFNHIMRIKGEYVWETKQEIPRGTPLHGELSARADKSDLYNHLVYFTGNFEPGKFINYVIRLFVECEL